MDFNENSSYQEGVISEIYQRPDRSYFHEPSELDSLISTGKLVQKFLPKQDDINKIPVTVKEIQAGYLISPYVKDLYLCLAQNMLPRTQTAICKVETLAENIYC